MARLAAPIALLAGLLLTATASLFSHKSVLNLGGAEAEEKLADGKAYLIKFYAPWCGHCKKLAPTWEDLAASFKQDESVAVAHVDCTVQKDLCTKHSIKGYPTLKLFHNGEEKTTYRGLRDLDSLKEFLEEQKKDLFGETEE